MNTLNRRIAAGATTVLATAALAACSGGSSAGGSHVANTRGATVTTSKATGLVGPGCDAYVAQEPSGAGSVAGMELDPLVTAASNNPLLSTLTQAVSGGLNKQVNLVSTLNGQAFTVFAPVDSAFAKVPATTIASLKQSKNRNALIKLLTYHLVVGQLAPNKILGTQTTVEGGSVKITGSGSTLKVNGKNVICGGIETANATIYMIDGVLTPPK